MSFFLYFSYLGTLRRKLATERGSNLLGSHTSQVSQWGLSAPSLQPTTPGHKCPVFWVVFFPFWFRFCFSQVFWFSLKANACWTGCPRSLACYRGVAPQTGSPRKEGGPARGEPLKSGPQKVQSRFHLQEKAHQVSRTFKCC